MSLITKANLIPAVAIAAATGIGGILGYYDGKQKGRDKLEITFKAMWGAGIGLCLATATTLAFTTRIASEPVQFFIVNGKLETRQELTPSGAIIMQLFDLAIKMLSGKV